MNTRPDTSSTVLSVENLVTSFRGDDGWTPVVKDVSFTVGAQETVAIVGESGSGKSVTALSIMRLLDPAASRIQGTIRLGDKSLLSASKEDIQTIRGNEIAMIFQEPMTSLNPVMTTGRQIAEALKLHRGMSETDAEAECVRLFEKVRIPDAKRRYREYPHQFSGGMRQRVMIAMALACRPKLLIADEPTTALDVTIQAQILELIKTLQVEEGMSVLFITHDMGVVAEIADRTIVMYNGEAVETGETRKIFEAPQHAYTRALLSVVPRMGQMTGYERPQRFSLIDPVSGGSIEAKPTRDTVIPSETPLLEVRNLTTRFDIAGGLFGKITNRVHAVENASFDVHTGETLSIVGESGCGKSTTGRSILRLIEPISGSVKLDGNEILKQPRSKLKDLRRSVQMIFQDPFASLNPRMSIGAAIAEPLKIHKICGGAEAEQKVADLLTNVGLTPDMASRYPHEFSGGQRQRICIARALALEPKLIVADESVSALDVSIKAQVINLMLDLQEKLNLSYLFISHDMAVVERISHRVAVMYMGEIVEIGDREALFSNPQHPYTRRLMEAVPVPDPSRRGQLSSISNLEIGSPIRDRDFVPPERQYLEVAPGHMVLELDDYWREYA